MSVLEADVHMYASFFAVRTVLDEDKTMLIPTATFVLPNLSEIMKLEFR